MKCLILYWSAGGNTEKIAEEINSVMLEQSISVDLIKITEDLNIDLFDYDLVFLGAPSYQWIPPVPVQKFIKNTMERYRGGIRPIGAPKKSGKFGVVFCTFCGVHTGLKEGNVAGKYMAQFFEHIGIFVLDEWYTPGKFHGWDEGNRFGKMGDISNRPDEKDLTIIRNNTMELLLGLNFYQETDKRI
ncbi:flavodoxin family protein [Anaerosacchariphilus polymeriproducens]|uniref:Nitric oxide synthase n=1 Tax=Anaerosacchariphilus polymeriproducens TaxID=1812858 RepID=A0A371AYE0_9FIRM|nr:flavodoxin domain-containing protein [Anaerosacchariphilus polymeriproducens]RDU24608.1 nitric oxide synthase [Anaerosacchariphilus polymeriproducens]